MAKITIDNITFDSPDGINLIQAGKLVGIHIPHFCYHPKLSLVGQCRLCLVEVEPIPKLQTACSTFVKEGMVVRTDTEKCRKARAAVMEFLLINHPLDCPECDQAGECDLQDYSFACGTCHSRFKEEKRTFPRDVDVGTKIKRIMDRCVHCTRCIRYYREIICNELMLAELRGNSLNITPLPGVSLDTMYTGNLHEVCPVGCLTVKDFRFKTRPWNLRSTASVCPLCANGCNIYIDERDNTVYRIKPRINEQVNSFWICDEGRFEFKFINSTERLAAPRVSGKDASWDDALAAAASGIQAVLRDYGAGAVAGVCAASITNEEAFLFKKLMAEIIGTKNIDHKLNDSEINPSAREDNLLRRLDKNPNTRGIMALCSDVAREATGSALAEKILRGDIKALILVRPSNKTLAGDIEKLVPSFSKLQCFVVIDTLETPAAKSAHALLPSATFAEKNGTFTNHAGKVQRIKAAVKSPGAARTELDIFLGLAAALGMKLPYRTDTDVYNKIKEILLKIESTIPEEADLPPCE